MAGDISNWLSRFWPSAAPQQLGLRSQCGVAKMPTYYCPECRKHGGYGRHEGKCVFVTEPEYKSHDAECSICQRNVKHTGPHNLMKPIPWRDAPKSAYVQVSGDTPKQLWRVRIQPSTYVLVMDRTARDAEFAALRYLSQIAWQSDVRFGDTHNEEGSVEKPKLVYV